jgi:hypothetical protein
MRPAKYCTREDLTGIFLCIEYPEKNKIKNRIICCRSCAGIYSLRYNNPIEKGMLAQGKKSKP